MRKHLSEEDLYIVEQYCSDVEDNTDILSRIDSLNLSCMDMRKLPEDIYVLRGLYELDISCNHLTDLPYTFPMLHNLKILNCWANNFEAFPNCLISMPNLRKVYIHTNHKLKELPKNVHKIIMKPYPDYVK